MMLMCTLSMIMTIVVLNLHHRSPEMYEMPDLVRRRSQHALDVEFARKIPLCTHRVAR